MSRPTCAAREVRAMNTGSTPPTASSAARSRSIAASESRRARARASPLTSGDAPSARYEAGQGRVLGARDERAERRDAPHELLAPRHLLGREGVHRGRAERGDRGRRLPRLRRLALGGRRGLRGAGERVEGARGVGPLLGTRGHGLRGLVGAARHEHEREQRAEEGEAAHHREQRDAPQRVARPRREPHAAPTAPLAHRGRRPVTGVVWRVEVRDIGGSM
jgi:hypothetical protein